MNNITKTAALEDERALASRLGVTVAALRRWRRFGQGPAYLKLGAAVRYRTEDVEAWLRASTVTPGASGKAA